MSNPLDSNLMLPNLTSSIYIIISQPRKRFTDYMTGILFFPSFTMFDATYVYVPYRLPCQKLVTESNSPLQVLSYCHIRQRILQSSMYLRKALKQRTNIRDCKPVHVRINKLSSLESKWQSQNQYRLKTINHVSGEETRDHK